jgi:acyl-CoA thioester hydrolase
MKELITYRGLVYPWQCDHMGHMNVMWYTGKFDEASWVLLARLGLNQTRLQDAHRAMAAVQQNITYKKELRAGDVVTIRTAILEIREKVLRFVHEMVKESTGEIAAIAELTGVHMDARTRRSIEFPPDILAAGQELISQPIEEDISDVVPSRVGEIESRGFTVPPGIGYSSLCE